MKREHKIRMNLGRRAAYLQKCLLAERLLRQHEGSDAVRIRVFYKHIKPILHCSYTHFNNMLNEINPQRQLDEIDAQLQQLSNK